MSHIILDELLTVNNGVAHFVAEYLLPIIPGMMVRLDNKFTPVVLKFLHIRQLVPVLTSCCHAALHAEDGFVYVGFTLDCATFTFLFFQDPPSLHYGSQVKVRLLDYDVITVLS